MKNANITASDAEELMRELNEKAAHDIANAQKIEWGIDEADAKVATELKTKLEGMKSTLVASKAQSLDANTKNAKFLSLFKQLVESDKIEADVKELIKGNIESLNKTIDNNDNAVTKYGHSIRVLEEVLDELNYKVHQDGKAYINKTAIKFARLIMSL